MSEHVPHSLPWRSVYPKGSKQNCAAVSAGDHYVYSSTFGDDDRAVGTVRMHQEYADFIVMAANNYELLKTENERLRNAIVKHRDDMWGDGSVGHSSDIDLYAALEEGER